MEVNQINILWEKYKAGTISSEEWDMLRTELVKESHNEMLQKDFVIGISKSDMLDDELKTAISKELPTDIPHLFISSLTHKGLVELKDILWQTLNKKLINK